jgi:hypothetical protein
MTKTLQIVVQPAFQRWIGRRVVDQLCKDLRGIAFSHKCHGHIVQQVAKVGNFCISLPYCALYRIAINANHKSFSSLSRGSVSDLIRNSLGLIF